MIKQIFSLLAIVILLAVGCSNNTKGINHNQANELYKEFKKNNDKWDKQKKAEVIQTMDGLIEAEEIEQSKGKHKETNNLASMKTMIRDMCFQTDTDINIFEICNRYSN